MKKWKKLLALILCTSMLAGLAACGKTEQAPEAENNTQTGEDAASDEDVNTAEAEETESTGTGYDGETVKIGFIGWGFTDTLGGEYKKYFEYMGPEFGIDFNLVVAVNQDEMVSQTESLIEAGVQGIISYQVTSSMMQLCEKNKVYLAQFGAAVDDQELKSYLEECEYWLGASDYDHYTCGVGMVDALHEAGCKNIITLGIAAGNPLHDQRLKGSKDEAEKFDDMNIIGEYLGNTASVAQEYSEQVTNFITMYPELDGITMTGASNGCMEAVLQAIDTAGKTGEIKLATLDVVEGTDIYLSEGSLVYTLGGQYPEVVFVALIMGDVIRGTLDLGGERMALIGNLIEVKGTEGFEQYKEYIEAEFPFTVDELKEVSPTFNSEATLQDIYDLWESYSIEDVMERHQH
ncbi:MAG: sugar ABC transporter substrate-binding protein [Lachnospiraceae bacterium]|jgi:ABC-type sugar transport system substrate-binding protein|nr:sugar ABC transporter substrate-binding protein [Lachnospiraceae bacterium]